MRQLKIVQSITNRGEGTVAKYLNDIGRISLIETEEEIALALKIKNGDKAALDKMVNTNLRFVVSVAKQYQNQGIPLGDLISEGNIGLIKAATRFDPTKGFKFISFAVWWIRQSIVIAIAQHKRVVKLPGNQIVGITKASKASQQLEQKLERSPTFTEISEYMELPEEKVADLISNSGMSYSLDACTHQESDFTLLDTLINNNSISPEEEMFRESLLYEITNIIRKLPEREQIILKYFYGLENYPVLTLDDIAVIIDLSKERARQLRTKAINSLKSICKTGRLANYF